MGENKNFNRLVAEFGGLEDPLAKAKLEMMRLLDADIQIAKQRYIDIVKKKSDETDQKIRKNDRIA